MVENGVASEYTLPITSGEITGFNNTYKATIAIQCLICGEGVELTENEQMCINYGRSIHSKVCDKCKAAVMKIRKEME